MNKRISKILNNKISGSNEILFELHEHLKNQITFIKIFPQFIDSVAEKFQSFENIQKYLIQLKKHLSKNELEHFFENYDKQFSNIHDKIFFEAKKHLSHFNNFLTISNSNTLFEFFLRLKTINKKFKVIICESRPKFEGRIFAKKLTLNKIKTEIITEAMIYSFSQKIDAGIIGADAILTNGNVINKIGSSLIALSCKEMKKPFYVLADKSKIKNSNKFIQKEMPPNEIWRHDNKNINIKNYYFEEVPKKFITKIISA